MSGRTPALRCIPIAVWMLAGCGDGSTEPKPVPPRLDLTFTAQLDSPWVGNQFGEGRCGAFVTVSAVGERGAWAELVGGTRDAEPSLPGAYEELDWSRRFDRPLIVAGESFETQIWWLGAPPGHEWILTLDVLHHDSTRQELRSSFLCG